MKQKSIAKEAEALNAMVVKAYEKELEKPQFSYHLQSPVAGILSLRFKTSITYRTFKEVYKANEDGGNAQLEAIMMVARAMCADEVRNDDDFWEGLEVTDAMAIMALAGEVLKKKTSPSRFSKAGNLQTTSTG